MEQIVEGGIFRSRWLLAPFYLGLVLALAGLLITFLIELVQTLPKIFSLSPEEVILWVLTLIDLSLAGNLVIIVVFSGYENFVSKINTGDNEDRPSWMGTLDFSGLKMKVIGSIVAISGISLLRAFMSLTQPEAQVEPNKLIWLVVLHVTFLLTGVMFALMDWLASRAADEAERKGHKGPVAP
ncbi:MAG: TIGR00645 family protein [Rhodospirillaceae bacterium]|nr:MAG: TIGR00645 family protein [Rhodospirillaceae bacterium]